MTPSPSIERPGWRHIADIVIGGAMLALAFVGIAASDVSGTGSQTYWTFLTLAFGLASLGVIAIHSGAGYLRGRAALSMISHWVGMLAAIEIVYLFIAAGRLTNADTGLLNGLVLALGTFLAGVHGNWRLAVIGATIGCATLAVAWLEQYLWALVGLGGLALAAVFLIGRLRGRM